MYLLYRLLLIIPTLWVILTLNFFIVQTVPGGPVEQALANIEFGYQSGLANEAAPVNDQDLQAHSVYRGSRGLDPEVIAQITKQFGFDKPILERYWIMLKAYFTFQFGESLFKNNSVLGLIKQSLPVSLSLGIWSTLIIYLIAIPLGIRKARYDGSRFDLWSSMIIVVGYAIPAFLLALLLIIVFAGGHYLSWFPLRGLTSLHIDKMSTLQKIADYFWHITLPVLSIVIGGFATLTILTKNSFIDEIRKQYVITARAKGLDESGILYRHVFRNAMLIIIAGFPAAFVGMFFTSSLLIEVMFSLNGLGLLGYEALLQRDYPVMFGTLYIFTLIGLLINIVSDVVYTLVDPRIHFGGQR